MSEVQTGPSRPASRGGWTGCPGRGGTGWWSSALDPRRARGHHYLTDPFGRKKLFIITLVLYLAATMFGAVLMIAAGIAEWFIGVEAAGKSPRGHGPSLPAEDEGAGAKA